MGFGFNIIFALILPVILAILTFAYFSKNKIALENLKIFGIGLVSLFATFQLLKVLSTNKLEKDDYYGEYIIDRSKFSGKQADWQYNHFRFKITDEDKIFFSVTENERIIKIYEGTITTVKPNYSERLVIQMKTPRHHILSENPTVYRDNWKHFYLVFESPKFKNVFFKKGKWKARD